MQGTEVVGKEPYKSNLLLKFGSQKLVEKHFHTFDSQVVPEPSLAMEIEPKLSSMKNFKRNLMSRILNEKNYANKAISTSSSGL